MKVLRHTLLCKKKYSKENELLNYSHSGSRGGKENSDLQASLHLGCGLL